MRLSVPLLTGAFCCAVASVASARDAHFELINHTGYQIDKVFTGQPSSNSWGKDIIGSTIFDDGETVNISLPQAGNGCVYDLYVRYHDGSHAQFDNINLCKFEKISLIWDGTVTRYAGE